jgi:methionine synthase II (cobalamin-independent)
MTLPPLRADQVGSLLRPAAFPQRHGRGRADEIDAATLRAGEDVAIAEKIRR